MLDAPCKLVVGGRNLVACSCFMLALARILLVAPRNVLVAGCIALASACKKNT